MNLKLVSKDNRRKLYEFGEGGNWKVAKYLDIYEDCVLGGHLHNKKDELFFIQKGEVSVSMTVMSTLIESVVTAPDTVYVPRGSFHSFHCKAGTIMICLASELHDDNDDIKDKA